MKLLYLILSGIYLNKARYHKSRRDKHDAKLEDAFSKGEDCLKRSY